VGDPAAQRPGANHPGRTRSTRSKARKRALDILFESELRGRTPIETLAERRADPDNTIRDYTADLVRGVQAHRAEIDDRITAHLSRGWTLERMPRVDRAAVRIAVFEIDHVAEVPDAVAVAEAVDLVGDLSTDESPAYVNGLLGAIVATKPAAGGSTD
jgi:N utilization substance protein B